MQKSKVNFLTLFQSLFAALSMISLTVPAFNMTGEIIKPLLLCFIGSVFICLGILFAEKSEKVVGLALLFLMIFWLIFAFVKEFILQYQAGFHFNWIEFFYFDKLLILGCVWLVCSLFFCFRRLIIKEKHSEYGDFFKYSGRAFIVFYSFLLVYSFVLIRLNRGDYPFRFQPFVTIAEYIENYDEIPYEVFMMFFGNLLYFTPLGYILSIMLRKSRVIIKAVVLILFPVVAFTLLEFSQYWLQNGYCEFDDMMMNSIGFWIGNLLCVFFDKISSWLSKGMINTFWQ